MASTIFCCPRCDNAFSDGFTCEDCELHFPQLAGIPVIVDHPNDWLVAHRESLLVTLAEFNLLDSVDLKELLLTKTDAHADAVVFSDDWTEHEFNGSSRPEQRIQIESWHRFINDCDSQSSISVIERYLKEELSGEIREPYRRVMLVLAPVSSRKTSLLMSKRFCRLFQLNLRALTSLRSCSLAWSDFF